MSKKERISEFLVITFATVVCGAAVFFFLVPSHLTVGSSSGLAIVISEIVHLPVSIVTFLLNTGLLLMGFLLIGREFGAKTVYTSTLVPVGFPATGVLRRLTMRSTPTIMSRSDMARIMTTAATTCSCCHTARHALIWQDSSTTHCC